MAVATKIVLIAEKLNATLWLGNGTAPTTITESIDCPQGFSQPKQGWFYIDGSTGTIYIYNAANGSTAAGWTSTSTKWTGGFL